MNWCIGKDSFGGLIFAFEATRSGALKANALPDRGKRRAARAVNGAGCAFIGAERRPLTALAGGSAQNFGRKGRESVFGED